VATCLGIEIGGTKLQLAVGSDDGNIEELVSLNAADTGESIREQIADAVTELLQTSSVEAVGVGFGGPVDRITGRIRCSHQVPGWGDFPLRDWIAELLGGKPVAVENDANVSALGEALAGAGKGSDPVAYVNMGSGVGGGLVVGGVLYQGQPPGEVEIGHLRMTPEGATLESRCSGWAVDRRIREGIQSQPGSVLAELCAGAGSGEARFLGQALDQGDALAERILQEICSDLAFGLSHVVQLFHPEVIVMGGGLAQLGNRLKDGVQRALEPNIMDVFKPGPEIRLAGLGQQVVPVGALLLAGRA